MVAAERARLFVAFELPEAVRDVLCTWQADTLSSLKWLRPVERDSLHVTLCFLGDRPLAAVAQVASECEALAGMTVGTLALGQPAWLPRRRPKVLTVALDDPLGALREAQALLATHLVDAGQFAAEQRQFFPHVTVARVRRDGRFRPVQLAGPGAIQFSGEAVSLMRSWLGSGPARYERLHRVQLAFT